MNNMLLTSPAELRADTAARSRIRAALTQIVGQDAYSCNLYHRPDGWYYQLHRHHMEHLGADVAEVAATIRSIAIVLKYEHWH